MNTELEDKDDYSWFEVDEEWDNKMKELYEERKIILQKSINVLSKLIDKYGVDSFKNDDILEEFVQIES